MSAETGTPIHDAGHRNKTTGRLVAGLIRLLLAVFAGAALGLLLYLGYIFIIRELVMQPTDDFHQAFFISETRQALASDRYDEKLREYSERMAVLESQHTLDAQMLDELQSDVTALQTAVEDQTAIVARISNLEAALAETQAMLEDNNQRFDSSEQQIADLQAAAQTVEAAGEDTGAADLLQEVRLLYALELLDRSRLYMLQNNLGLAEQDILHARDILLVMQETASIQRQDKLEDLASRLEAVAEELPQSPRLAAINLETAWNLMVTGLESNWIESTTAPLNLSPTGTQQEPAQSETPEPDD